MDDLMGQKITPQALADALVGGNQNGANSGGGGPGLNMALRAVRQ